MRKAALGLLLVLVTFASSPVAQTQVTPPEKFFGHQLGADRKLARWDRIVEYFRELEKQSDRLQVVDMGRSTMGNPFLLVFISSPANLARLEQYRQMNAKLSDPRGVPEAEIRKVVAEGKAVIIQSMSLHATEVGGSQMAPELAYDLASRTDSETERILENVIFLMIPSFNPDGQVMVTDWYRKYIGTEYEGAGLPWLYHKYVGHDNNRDAFQTNMIESQYMAKVMFREWIPQAYIDHHHMGSYGARLYVPPYAEPVRPSGDPLVWREISWYGGHIAYKEEEHNKSGIVNAAIYSGWGHFGFHWITPFHNVAGMLTESASARLATPLYIHPDQLRGQTRGLPEYEEQTTFPNPWP
ncbi:MAG TPA: M14 metallopeptidase family protein, partial [Vicinamibacterales bacterium]|nr:M14 metallopeptidase family protein [Vicinamibacterales bacterium]